MEHLLRSVDARCASKPQFCSVWSDFLQNLLQEMFDKVTYYTQGGASLSGVRTLYFTVSDPVSSSGLLSAARTISVTAINNAPQLIGPTGDTGYNALGPFFIQPTVVVFDADSNLLNQVKLETQWLVLCFHH